MKFNKEKAGSLCLGILAGLIIALLWAVILCGGFSGFRSVTRYAAVMQVVRQNFIGGYDRETFTDGALSGAVSSLDDRWSYYMNAEQYADYLDFESNRYQGIGVTVTDDEAGGFLVNAVVKDGPAQQAGIVPGDRIVSIDGNDVTDSDMETLRSLIQADYGKVAMVTVVHEDGSGETFAVSCEAVYQTPVEYELLAGHVGYVAIYNFHTGAGADAIAAVEELLAAGADCLVFDVRDNLGGFVTEMAALLDYLLPEGEIFVSADKNGREDTETSDAACVEMPMAVIVNGGSYSAAEFFAAVLREYDWAVLVGEHTTGKSRSQITIPLMDGGAVHISKYAYTTPGGVDLYEAGGIEPDVEALLTEEEQALYDTGWLELSEDPQVRAAVTALGDEFPP